MHLEKWLFFIHCILLDTKKMFKNDFKGLFICVGPPYVYIFFISVSVPWSESEFLVFWVSLWLLHLAPATCNSKSSQRDCFMSMLQPAASSFQTNLLPCHPWQPPFTLTQVAPPTPSETRHPCSLCASLLGSVLLRHKHALRTHRHKNITKYQHIHCEKVLEFPDPIILTVVVKIIANMRIL